VPRKCAACVHRDFAGYDNAAAISAASPSIDHHLVHSARLRDGQERDHEPVERGLTETGYHRQSGEGSNWGTNPVSAGRATRSAGAKSPRSPTNGQVPNGHLGTELGARHPSRTGPRPLGETVALGRSDSHPTPISVLLAGYLRIEKRELEGGGFN
jgi:hypothetical protein